MEMQRNTKQRVEQELKDLEEKTEKLKVFLISNESKNIDKLRLNMLAIQFSIMNAYMDILRIRLLLWEEK